MERTVVAVFDSRQEAEAAVQDVVACGVDRQQVHLREGSMEDVPGTKAADEAIRRAGWGDHLGDEHSGQYREALRRGSCLVAVDPLPQDKAMDVAAALSRHDPINLDDRVAGWRERGWQGYDAAAPRFSEQEVRTERDFNAQRPRAAATTGDTDSDANASRQQASTIPVVEEDLAVGKRMVERGGVRIYTRVTERPVEESVTLREEHARVQRRDVDRPATEADLRTAFKEGSMEIAERSEEAVVSKQARVVGEVDVGKDVSERTEKVKDTVRRSDVEVEDLAASRTTGNTGTTGADGRTRTPRRT